MEKPLKSFAFQQLYHTPLIPGELPTSPTGSAAAAACYAMLQQNIYYFS